MNDNKCISIIIPIYNAEKYLTDCIDSIINQKYNNLEIILINDGSTDNSQKICEEYANKDKRVKLINQKNQGVSVARNKGIDIASGEIIMFVDSDDIMTDSTIDDVVSKMNNYDLLCFGYSELYKDKKIKIVSSAEIIDKKDFENRIVLNNQIGGYLWNKAFLKSIIEKNNIKFNEEIHFCEDLLFVINYFKYCKKLFYINKSLYLYRMRKSSVSFDFFNTKNISILKSYEKLIEIYSDDPVLSNNLKYNYLLCYYKMKNIIPSEYERNSQIISQEKNILKSINLSLSEKIKYFIIKRLNFLYKVFRKVKISRLNLFD